MRLVKQSLEIRDLVAEDGGDYICNVETVGEPLDQVHTLTVLGKSFVFSVDCRLMTAPPSPALHQERPRPGRPGGGDRRDQREPPLLGRGEPPALHQLDQAGRTAGGGGVTGPGREPGDTQGRDPPGRQCQHPHDDDDNHDGDDDDD